MSEQKLIEKGDGIGIEMAQDKVCKHSIRYATKDPDAVITNVYVSKRALGDPAPTAILVQVSVR